MKDKTEIIVCVSASFFIFLVYLFSLCPTLYLIDAGELATVSYTLGVAHPTGYPLYTLISYFFSHLPGTPIYNLNLLSALFSLAAAVVLLARFRGPGGDRGRDHLIIGLIPAFMFAFAPTVWRSSVTNEVYPLTGLFSVLILMQTVNLRTSRDLYLLAYVIGLSFTNHMIIFSLALPAIGYVLLTHRLPWKKILAAALLLIAGLTLYLYLLFRSQRGADIAWGDTVTIQRLIWHVTGRQYRVWMFSSDLPALISNLKQGLAFLARDLLYVFILPALAGIWFLFKNRRALAVLFISIIALDLLYTVNYSIPDIESYYLPALTALVCAAGYGMKRFARYLRWPVAVGICLALPLLNYRASTARGVTFGRDYGIAHIAQLPDRALLITTYWDIYSPIMYLRKVEGMRKDLIVIDKELLRRTWYLRYLQRAYPDFMNQVKPALENYWPELVKFEYGRPYDRLRIQQAFLNLLTSMIETQGSRGVYLASPYPDPDLEQAGRGLRRIPFGPTVQVAVDASRQLVFDFARLSLSPPVIMNDPRLAFNWKVFQNLIRNNIAYLRAVRMDSAAQAAEAWLKGP